LLAVLATVPAVHAERWQMQYFYDQDRASFNINDLRCPSARRCIAAGFVDKAKSAPKPMAVVTSDAGGHWTEVPLKEVAVSLFFLSDSSGWMVGTKSLWRTEEAGRSWEKVGKLPTGAIRVYFLDAAHGWAVGTRKSVYETNDGGKNWKSVPAAASPNTNVEYTAYTWIEFTGKDTGVITGWSRPPRRGDTEHLPDWIDPENAVKRRQWPTLSITLDTHDGGKNWAASTASLFGQISRVRLLPDGVGLGLVSFDESFAWPCEIFRIDWKTGKSTRAFRDRTRAITDLALVSSHLAYLAGEEIAGQLHSHPIPGKLKILKSTDLASWAEMEVDYRANASRAMLAPVDENNIWVATNTGMILKLVP
jgi:photosynthesis system II assembly factor YCF48-like protein